MAYNAAQANSDYVYRLVGANTTNAQIINAAPCWLTGYSVGNINAAPVYLKIYDKATAPTVGTDVPVFVVMIPGATTGAGANVTLPQGLYLINGLAMGLVAGLTDGSTTAPSANEQIVNILYKKVI